MSEDVTFLEKQYMGFNRFGLMRRMVITLFCFVFYFTSDDTQGNTADIFFYLGIGILVMSAGALLISHLETRIEGNTLTLIGPMTHKKVVIEMSDISDVVVMPYSKFLMNRPMFNLHRKNARRFYTHGNGCVEFTANGERIKLGTQRAEELKRILDK
jgi:hypothetical protein